MNIFFPLVPEKILYDAKLADEENCVVFRMDYSGKSLKLVTDIFIGVKLTIWSWSKQNILLKVEVIVIQNGP